MRFILCLIALFCLCAADADAACGGGSGRGGLFARRAERRQSRMMSGASYSSSMTMRVTYSSYGSMRMMQGCESGSCAPGKMVPPQAPPMKK